MRLQKLLAIPAFLLPLVLAGCVNDDRSDCIIESNLELRFAYDAQPGVLFSDVITSVDALVFDAGGIFKDHIRVDQNELEIFRGIRMQVKPSTYYILAWANVRDNTAFNTLTPGETTLEEGLIDIRHESTETGDPVYYAPYKEKPAARGRAGLLDYTLYEVHVPRGQNVEKTLRFVRAHRTINVWVYGHFDIHNESLEPTVGVTNLWTQYDFFFTTRERKQHFRRLTHVRSVSDKNYSFASFHSALGTFEDDMNIIVYRTSDGAVSHTVNLRRFIAQNNVADTDEIDILIRYQDLGVSVTLPTWEGKPVNPGYEPK